MCGRYTLTLDLDGLVEWLRPAKVEIGHQPRFNIAPGQEAPVLFSRGEELTLAGMRWGLVPAWADVTTWKPLINARAETVATKPSFRRALRQRRCLAVADGFYEWQAGQEGKIPWRITLPDQRPFALAALWEEHPDTQGGPGATFAIITTSANDQVRPLHARMPALLSSREAREAWLWGENAEVWQQVLQPTGETLSLYPVSSRVNSPKNEDPSLVEPA